MKAIITIIVLALIAWGAYALWGDNRPDEMRQEVTQEQNQNPPSSTATSTVKEFIVVGKNFSFSPANIEVNEGDTVRIVFQNQGGNHDWVVDEFNARTKILSNGQTETIEFVADEKGSFEYYCSVGEHRAMGMKGTLVVK